MGVDPAGAVRGGGAVSGGMFDDLFKVFVAMLVIIAILSGLLVYVWLG